MTLFAPVALQPPLIDAAQLADLRAALGEDESDMLLGLMIRDIAFRVKLIVTAIAEDDGAKARTEAHCLRGAADGIGALRLAQSCSLVEFGHAHNLPGMSAMLTRCGTETIAAISIARAQRVISRL
jgi:HPt (histidine-containing phosphotransfer) domain-containing protein